jgi:SAM-dependent methyltransferase
MAMRDSVQASYAARALGQGSCCDSSSGCCSPGVITLDEVGTVQWESGYSSAEKGEIPEEAAEISLGCGNPIAMAGLKPGEVVLDIGSGGGIDVFLASKRVGPTGFVYGIDMTPAMLQRARKAAKKGEYTNVKFRHGYAEKLPVKDSEIDVIISNCVINLTEDKGKVFREAFRALKPGGRLEVNDMVFGGPIPLSLRDSIGGWSECISGALPEQEYVDLVSQAGFKDISVRRSTSSGISAGVPVYSVQVSAKK